MEQQKDSTGAIIGSAIIIVILILGGIYFGKKAAREMIPRTPAEEVAAMDEIIANDPAFQQVESQAGTAAVDLETSLNNVNLNTIDSVDLQGI